MRHWGTFAALLMACCLLNQAFGDGKLHHIIRAQDSVQVCVPEGISADGNTVVGDARDGNYWEAFRWNPGNTASPFLILEPRAGDSGTGNIAYDVSADGRIIVGGGPQDASGHTYPKIWMDDSFVDYDVSFGGPAYAVSDDGHIIATTEVIPSLFSSFWTIPVTHWWDFSKAMPPDYDPNVRPSTSDFITLPLYDPPDTQPASEFTGSRPAGISGDGTIIVGRSDFHTNPIAVRWYNNSVSGWLVEPFEPWNRNLGSTAVAASYNGEIIVGNTRFNIGTEADPDWQWRGFAWPFPSWRTVVWGKDSTEALYVDSTQVPEEIQVAAGAGHTFVLDTNGEVTAWGWNDDPLVQPPGNLGIVTEIDAGHDHVIALLEDKTVVAWGHNDFGQTDVPDGLINVKAIAAGQYHNLALIEDGTVVAWGWNEYGQTDVPQFTQPVKDITAGYGHSLALLEDGSIRGWGLNDNGQAEDPGGLENVVAIEAGFYHNLTLDSSGGVYAWGLNSWGQADWFYIEEPVIEMSAGHEHSIVLYADFTIGVLGHYSQADHIPSTLSQVTSIAAGEQHSVVIDLSHLRMLDTLPFEQTQYLHDFTEAFDVSGDGRTIVGRSGYGNIVESIAVYWDATGAAHKLEDLVDEASRAGWEFEGISAVDHDGVSMAGFGKYIGNNGQGWHLSKAYNDGYSDADDLGNDWYNEPVMGVFWRAGKSHVWHNQHGWQQMEKGKHEIRLFDYGTDSWLWTDAEKYPYMYRYGENPGWVYYLEGGTPGHREFYHVSQEIWMTEEELAGGG